MRVPFAVRARVRSAGLTLARCARKRKKSALEFVSGGELFDAISSRGRLHEEDARRIFQQMMSAIAYCHCAFVRPSTPDAECEG